MITMHYTFNEEDLEHRTYSEINHQPLKLSSRRAVCLEFGEMGWYWRKGWSKMMGGVDKVNPEALLGMHVNDVVSRYLPRLASQCRTPEWVLDQVGLFYARRDKDGDLIFRDPRHDRWMYRPYYKSAKHCVYYIHPRTGIIKKHKLEDKSWRPIHDHKYHKRWYEDRAKKRKNRREIRQQNQALNQQQIDWLFTERKRVARAFEKMKLEQHGFDPITSFRNH